MKMCPFKRVAFLEGNYLVVFYFSSASEIWSDKRDGFWWEGPYKSGDYFNWGKLNG